MASRLISVSSHRTLPLLPFKSFSRISSPSSPSLLRLQSNNVSSSPPSLEAFSLSPIARTLLDREKRLFASLLPLLASSNASKEDQQRAADALQSLNESLFLLVVCGEFNSGKSSLLNALLGKKYLKEGVTPTTSRISLIRFGENKNDENNMDMDADDDSVLDLYLPVPWLKDIAVVDSPGTNAIIRRHEELTTNFIPRCDLVLFVTSADRPFSESERVFLERIRGWGKKVIVIINKSDILEDEESEESNQKKLTQVEEFVRNGLKQMMHGVGFEPKIFFVSARFAGKYKFAAAQSNSDLYKKKSRFEALESYIFHELDSSQRIKLKLESTLGVADALLKKYYQHEIQYRFDVLKEDEKVLLYVENQMNMLKDDLKRDFKAQWVNRLDNVLLRLQERATAFFDEELRASNFINLVMKKQEIQKEFERRVMMDTNERMKSMILDVVDWSVERKYSTWKDVIGYVERSQINGRGTRDHHLNLIGKQTSASDFDFHRQSILKNMMSKVSEDVSSSLDKEKEVKRLHTLISDAVLQTASVAVSGIGLGALSLAFLPALDAAGVVGATAAVSLGSLAILPMKRRQLKQQFTAEIQTLRQRLEDSLMANFEDDLAASLAQLNEALGPYSRFVRSESQRLKELSTAFEGLEAEAKQIRTDVHRNLNATAAVSIK